jgi:hypothetical protein
MASIKGGKASERDELESSHPQRDSGVTASTPSGPAGPRSGVRDERETTPAPPGVADEWASFPSERPTSVPTYDVAAVAFETSMRHQSPAMLPFDVAIPTRTKMSPPPHLELRASFLLLHVDGQSSVHDIAELTGFPVADVLAAFLSLMTQGLVELGGTHAAIGVPVSGERTRHEPDPEE